MIESWFMIVPEADRYRWAGRKFPADGRTLANVREAPVAAAWAPMNVEWLPETRDRPVCDFPIFTPVVRCMSMRAAKELRQFLSDGVELLPLLGIGDYVAFHCIKWLDAADLREAQPTVSIYSTTFVPPLKIDAIKSHHVFGVPPMIAKVFVSLDFKRAYEAAGLVGLDFIGVPVR